MGFQAAGALQPAIFKPADKIASPTRLTAAFQTRPAANSRSSLEPGEAPRVFFLATVLSAGELPIAPILFPGGPRDLSPRFEPTKPDSEEASPEGRSEETRIWPARCLQGGPKIAGAFGPCFSARRIRNRGREVNRGSN